MARIFQLESDDHLAVQSLLPWYANGTLEAGEAAHVRAHLTECGRCQADLAWQQKVRDAATSAQDLDVATDLERHWATLRQQLEPAPQPRAVPRHIAVQRWLATRWLPLAFGIQSLIVLVLTLAWLGAAPQRDEAFRTLGATPNAIAANALVVFRPTATEAEIRRALRAHRARLVAGPTVTDAYLLHLPVLSPESLSLLRADDAVLRVEALEGDAR